jgi:transposase
MKQQRKKYTAEFKREVLAMVAEDQRSVAQIERDLGITTGLIYKWQARYEVKDSQLQPSADRTEAARIRQLERELAIVKQERDILKKAIQIFSQDQRL